MKKHEREIRELLEKMDNFLPDNPPADRGAAEREPKKKVVGVMQPAPRPIPIRQSRSTRLRGWLREHRISTGLACIIGGFGLVIVGLIVKEFLGKQSAGLLIAEILVAAGAILFLFPIFLRFFTGRDISDPDSGTQYWRGQALDDSGFTWQTVKRWFQGRKRPTRTNNPWNNNDRNRNNRW
jgi:hypothetical protein